MHGTLESLAARLDEEPIKNAAIVIVGSVAGLRDHLRWYDARPLFGRRIIVTRAREQARELVDRLEELGADTIEAPSFLIEAVADTAALDEACARAGSFQWLVFTSQNGVEHFMRRLLAGPGDVRSLKGPRICAVGPATAERLSRYGLKVDLVPSEHRAEAVVEAMRLIGELQGATVLFPRADIAREVLVEELRRHGAEVTEVVAYRTMPESGREHDPDIYKMLLERQIDVVTFTSASSVRHFVKTLGEDQAADLLRSTAVASIGPVTAEAAQQLGIKTTIMPGDYTVPGLVTAILEYVGSEQDAATPA
jgi:uroporphyrinogen III methyltransferase / synthase